MGGVKRAKRKGQGLRAKGISPLRLHKGHLVASEKSTPRKAGATRVRSPRVSKGKPQSHSALRDEVWAMVSDHLRHLGCTYDEALALADKYRGLGFHSVVMTDAAAKRIHASGPAV